MSQQLDKLRVGDHVVFEDLSGGSNILEKVCSRWETNQSRKKKWV